MSAKLRGARNGSSPGLAAALVSAVLFGATTPIAKQLLEGASPLLVAGLLYLGSGIGVTLLKIVQDRGSASPDLARSDLLLAWPAQLASPGRSLGLLSVAAACLCWGL